MPDQFEYSHVTCVCVRCLLNSSRSTHTSASASEADFFAPNSNIFCRRLILNNIIKMSISILRSCTRYAPKMIQETTRSLTSRGPRSKGKLVTIPNALTVTRIATSPAIGYFILNGMHSHALACFAFAATTDLLDGIIARKFNQESDVGALLDPIADKLLMTTCFVTMYNAGLMPMLFVRGFVARDVFILTGGTVFRYFGFKEKPTLKQFFDFRNHPTIGFEPTFISKCNTALQCLCIVLTLGTDHLTGIPYYQSSLTGLLYITLGTTCASLAQYMNRLNMMNANQIRIPRRKG